jgi:hypothetical protein
MIEALRVVFRNVKFLFISFFVFFFFLSLSTLLPNLGLLSQILKSPDVSFRIFLSLLASLFQSITTNFTALTAIYTIVISALLGIYTSMVLFFLERRVKDIKTKNSSLGFWGIISAVLGVGCAACGSFLLTSLLSVVSAQSLLLILPLKGAEFGIIAIILLSLAINFAGKKITDPLVCKID